MADQTLAKFTSISGIPMTGIRVGGWKETPSVHATSLQSEHASNEDSTVINNHNCNSNSSIIPLW